MNSKINNLKYIAAISIVIILAIATLAIACIGCTNSDLPDSSFNITDGDGNVLSGDKVYDMPSQLNFTAAALAANPAGITVQIKATVQPDTAANKAVDWSVAWADASNSPNIASYLQVVPISDGSTTATVTCLAALPKDIYISVITREGGFEDTCVVKFIGKPSSISVSCPSLSPSNNTYGLGVGVTYDFNVTMDNAIHSVGSTFTPGVSIEATGSLTVGTYETDPRGSKVWYNERSANLSEFKDDIISYTVDSNTVRLTLTKSIEGYYSSKTSGGTVHTFYNRVKSIDSECYFTVTILSGVTGVTTSFKIVVDSNAVTGVSIGIGELTF